MLEAYMVQSCTVYKQTVDEYNNLRQTGSFTTTCHLREDEDSVITGGLDERSTTAMAWFRPAEDVVVGDVIDVQNKSYTITKVVAARRLGEAQIQFKKCFLERFDSFVS